MASVSTILRIITDVMDKIDPENRSTLPILLDKRRDPPAQKKHEDKAMSASTSESTFEQADSTSPLKDLSQKDKSDKSLLQQRYTNDRSCLKQTRSISPTALDQPSGEGTSQAQLDSTPESRKSVSFHSVVQVRVREDLGFIAQQSPSAEEKRLEQALDFAPHPNVSTYSLLGNMKEMMILKGESYFDTELFREHFAKLKHILSQPYANFDDLQSAVAPLLAIFTEKLQEASPPPVVMFSNLRSFSTQQPARQRARSFMDLSASNEDEPKCSFPTLSCVVS